MKTINFLTSHYLPENTAGTNRVLAYVKQLDKKYKVNVICLTERGNEINPDFRRSEDHNNVDIYYLNQPFYDTEKFFSRALKEMQYSYLLAKKASKIDCDVTIATSPFMFLIPALAIVSNGSKKILDIRDITWEYIEGNTKFKSLIKKVISKMMMNAISKYDFVCVTNNFEENWVKTNTTNSNMKKIANGIEENKFQELSTLEISEDSPFTITYIGNIAVGQNVQTLVDAAKDLKNVKVNIVGEGTKYASLKKYVIINKITNVEFFGKVKREEIAKFYKNTTVLYAQLDEHFKTAMPSKLYEYASTGLPIIYGGIGEAVSFVEKLENAITIPPNNPEELKKAILKIKSSSFVVSKKNKDLVKNNFIRESQSSKIIEIIENLTKDQ
jgi:glycosyltransferase involved in cell wall biosynthesis